MLPKEPSEIPEAQFIGDRAIVWDTNQSMMLYSQGYFGQPVGIRKPKSSVFDKPLELSLLECAYLAREESLRVKYPSENRDLGYKDILEIGMKASDSFHDRLLVYSQLRERGYVVRPGLKFGTDFALYEHGPGKEHAPLLVHVIPQKKGIVPLDIVRAGRLATSVRKKLILATVKESGQIAYYSFVWHRP
ncbi:MAG: tRNA-intron lyase [Candidatus Thorarchaeota archaeon]|jgi:tRNA-intron endonuclease